MAVERYLQWKQFDQQRWQFERYAISEIRKALKSQLQFVFNASSPREALGGVELMPRKPMMDAYTNIYGRVGGYFASRANRLLKRESGSIEAKELSESEWVVFLRQWVALNGAERVQQVNLTTIRRLQVIIQSAIESGIGIEELSRKIVTQGSGIADINRARVIARTEIITASNVGNLRGAIETGIAFDREWLATQDNRTRDAHITADGQRIQQTDEYVVGGESLKYPADINGSAANVINCRCVEKFIPIR